MNVPEPLTPAQEGFASLHEFWNGLLEAGFSEQHAALVIAALAWHQQRDSQ